MASLAGVFIGISLAKRPTGFAGGVGSGVFGSVVVPLAGGGEGLPDCLDMVTATMRSAGYSQP